MPMLFKGVNGDEEPMDIVGSHQRCLIAACMRTIGPILELGVGWYSTPLLHEIGRAQNRIVRTIDNNTDWLNQFKSLECTTHEIVLTGWWGDANLFTPAGERWGVAFIDQGQPIEREYTIRRLIDLKNTDIFVMHDTEEGFAYGYDRTLPMFKYKCTDKCQKAWTTIASNTIDVKEWGIRVLPFAEPTKDVT